jgi:hypothetical protein
MDMSYSYESSTSSSKSFTTSESTITGDGQTIKSLSFIATVSTSTPDGSEGLVGVVSGDATAVGEDTLTFGSLEAEIADTGAVSALDASVTMFAAAESPDGDEVYASAGTFAAASDTTEVTFTTTLNTSSTTKTPHSSTAIASSTTTISALEIESEIAETTAAGPSSSTETIWDLDDEVIGTLDGNVAILEFGADAFGGDTYLAVDGVALAIEDELSMSAGYLEIAVA